MIKNNFEKFPQWKDSKGKYDIHSNMEELLGENCEVGNLMKCLKEIELFDDIGIPSSG